MQPVITTRIKDSESISFAVIDIKAIGPNPSNPRTKIDGPIRDILIVPTAHGFEIQDGNIRAVALANLGQLVPALDADSGRRVLLKRDPSGQWLIATESEVELARVQDLMRVSRKSNSGVRLQPKATPFYRQFVKQRF